MTNLIRAGAISLLFFATQSFSLSLAPEEFKASRMMACVLAQQSLGQLSENEYGEKANSLLDGFDDTERDHILAQAVGYFGGVIFTAGEEDAEQSHVKLQEFVSSHACSKGDYSKVTLNL